MLALFALLSVLNVVAVEQDYYKVGACRRSVAFENGSDPAQRMPSLPPTHGGCLIVSKAQVQTEAVLALEEWFVHLESFLGFRVASGAQRGNRWYARAPDPTRKMKWCR